MARRDPWFDSTKMLLVTLVVVGHAWTLLPSGEVTARLYDGLYLWHMPAFLLVTGYLSRNVTWSRRDLSRLVTGVAVPYVIFEGALAAFRIHVGGEELENLWLDPHWAMWFLVALVLWRLAAPALLRLRPLHAITLSVAISLLGGLVDVPWLDLNRVLGFLPFFTIGLVLSPRHVDLVRSSAARRFAVPAALTTLVVAEIVHRTEATEWLYFRTPYADLEVSWQLGMAVRATQILVAVGLAVAVLAWVPRRDGWFARMGAASLVVYLFHTFVVRGAEYAGVPDWAAAHPNLGFVTVTLGAVAVALLLAHRRVARPLGEIATPVPTQAFATSSNRQD